MSRRRNCQENTDAVSFFQLLKREWIKRKTDATRVVARQDGSEHIEMFYNPKRKHTYNGMLSNIDFENRQRILNAEAV